MPTLREHAVLTTIHPRGQSSSQARRCRKGTNRAFNYNLHMHGALCVAIAILILGSASFLGGTRTVQAASPFSLYAIQEELTLQVLAGFDGYYRSDHWIPVQVFVANNGQDIEGEIQVTVNSNSNVSTLYTYPAILPTRSRKQFTIYVLVPEYSPALDVRLVEGSANRSPGYRTLAEQTVPIQPLGLGSFLCGIVSDDTSSLNYLAGLPRIDNRQIHVFHLNLSDIPSYGSALESVDALILNNTDTLAMSEVQREALRSWVSLGGHLVVGGGPNAERTAAGLDSLLPIEVEGTLTTADIGTLGEFVDAPLLPGIPAVVAQVTTSSEAERANEGDCSTGCVLVGTLDLPLLIRRTLDRGYIDYLALDPDLEPMRTWIGNYALWLKLFATAATASSTSPLPSPDVRPNPAYANSALANIPNLDVPSALTIAAVLLVYIVVIGPLNFAILKRLDKRALAWVTVPVLVFVFSGIGYIVGLASRGRQAIVSQATIVRTLPESRMAVVDGFVGLYSPLRARYDIQLPAHTLPYVSMSPTYTPPAAQGPQELTVDQGPHTFLRELQVDVGAMRTFATHTTQLYHPVEAQLTIDLVPLARASRFRVTGTISNVGELDIRDCVLVWGTDVVPLADLPAGATEQVAVEFDARQPRSGDQYIETLLGSKQGRERERRRQILNSLVAFSPYPTSSAATGADPSSTPTLIGWSDVSPSWDEIAVNTAGNVKRGARTKATVTRGTSLYVISLPVTPSDPNILFLPMRTIRWTFAGEGEQMSPYALRGGDDAAILSFELPVAGRPFQVERLSLHIDALNPAPHWTPPVVYIKETDSGEWRVFPSLTWGRNDLVDPKPFVQRDGKIEIKVATSTIPTPLSIDLTGIVKLQ